jgi:hypothetical protein
MSMKFRFGLIFFRFDCTFEKCFDKLFVPLRE